MNVIANSSDWQIVYTNMSQNIKFIKRNQFIFLLKYLAWVYLTYQIYWWLCATILNFIILTSLYSSTLIDQTSLLFEFINRVEWCPSKWWIKCRAFIFFSLVRDVWNTCVLKWPACSGPTTLGVMESQNVMLRNLRQYVHFERELLKVVLS